MVSRLGPLAQRGSAALDEVRAFHDANLLPDTYQIERGTTRTADGSGGYTDVPVVVETGPCSLRPASRLGVEGLSGDVIEGATSYEVLLPVSTTLMSTDTLIINDIRRFAVVNPPRRGGAWTIHVVADVEERF